MNCIDADEEQKESNGSHLPPTRSYKIDNSDNKLYIATDR